MNSIEKILFWQEPINYFLQKAAAGWLLYLWNFFSVLANPAIFLLVFVLYYWNINKDKGRQTRPGLFGGRQMERAGARI